jgi:ABC-type hemin transport system substrate-binding protein
MWDLRKKRVLVLDGADLLGLLGPQLRDILLTDVLER